MGWQHHFFPWSLGTAQVLALLCSSNLVLPPRRWEQSLHSLMLTVDTLGSDCYVGTGD